VRIRAPEIAALLPALLVAGACTNEDERAPAPDAASLQPASAVAQPPGWNDELALPVAQDLDPDPNVLEVELEARVEELEVVPGTRTPVWTYNGSLPGPMIRAKLGDKIIVHFKNSLPEATSIHWHGLRVPNEMDGVPGLTQAAIAPGAEFRYEFVARDAGTYWYHPHLNSAAQVGSGLYAPLIVEDPADPAVFGDELVLVLSDMSLDETGQFLPPDHGGEFGDLFGREGRVLLVNGKVRPHLKVRAGKQQRWRVVNAARARYYTIQLRGHTLIKLGGDNGLAARSRAQNRIVLVPGERADLVFTPSDAPGTSRTFEWIPTERGFGSVYNRPREDIMYIDTVADAAVAPEAIPELLRPIEPIDVANAKELTLDLTIATETMRDGKEVVMGVNGIPYWRSKPLEAHIGETHIWTIRNDTDFSHPFHLHGYFFQVLDDTRVPEWKDTVDVASRSSLRIAVRFDERPGVWMYHCHILDHAESGMMGHLWVAAESEHAHMPHIDLIH
jgi:FtsP/CotA-like multicopper oxidase with cupredoxin domain